MAKINDCIAAGEIIVGSMVTPDNKSNVLHVTSVGPDCKLQVRNAGGKARPIMVGDDIYVRAATTIPNTVDLNWLTPDMVVGLKEDPMPNCKPIIGDGSQNKVYPK